MHRFFLSILFISTGTFALDCNQIQTAQIFDGNTVFLPGPNGDLQSIPANFNCTYTISVPANSTDGYFAKVSLKNGLKGVNDFMIVKEIDGTTTTVTSRTITLNDRYLYYVTPGAQMTIQVTTRSVLMGSQFSVTVDFHAVKIGSPTPLKTGAEMNYIDVKTMRGGSNSEIAFITYSDDEPIHLSVASLWNATSFDYCYVLDGTFENSVSIVKLENFGLMTTNSITIVTFSSNDLQFVVNPSSEAKPLSALLAAHADQTTQEFFLSSYNIFLPEVIQVVNFDSIGIVLDELIVMSTPCKAYVISGPPNNSSEILLDLSKNPAMPQTFNVKYLSLVEEDCAFRINVKSAN